MDDDQYMLDLPKTSIHAANLIDPISPLLEHEVAYLGELNVGSFGPNGSSAEENQVIAEAAAMDLSRPEYDVEASRTWDCVDGRGSEEELQTAESAMEVGETPEEANPQTAGGLAVTDASAEYMLNDRPKPIDQTLGDATETAAENGQAVIVHGDNDHGEEGCKALKEQDKILTHGAANVDVFTPIVWQYGAKYGINTRTSDIEDVSDMYAMGGRNAADPELWKSSIVDRVAAIKAAGGTYKELLGEHNERGVRVKTGRGAFAKPTYMLDHANPVTGELDSALSATFGELNAYYDLLVRNNVISRPEADKRMLAAIAWNVAAASYISNAAMPIVTVA
jgi:hypothetical protein